MTPTSRPRMRQPNQRAWEWREEMEERRRETDKQQNLLLRASGDAYGIRKSGWFSWSVTEIDYTGEVRDIVTHLQHHMAILVAEELCAARKSGIEDGYQQGVEWGTRSLQD